MVDTGFFALTYVLLLVFPKLVVAKRNDSAKLAEVIAAAAKDIDYNTLVLLTGLFVVVGSLTEAGVIDEISSFFVSIGNDNVFLIYSLIVWVSVLLSAVLGCALREQKQPSSPTGLRAVTFIYLFIYGRWFND